MLPLVSIPCSVVPCGRSLAGFVARPPKIESTLTPCPDAFVCMLGLCTYLPLRCSSAGVNPVGWEWLCECTSESGTKPCSWLKSSVRLKCIASSWGTGSICGRRCFKLEAIVPVVESLAILVRIPFLVALGRPDGAEVDLLNLAELSFSGDEPRWVLLPEGVNAL